jgi:hypothetical protein
MVVRVALAPSKVHAGLRARGTLAADPPVWAGRQAVHRERAVLRGPGCWQNTRHSVVYRTCPGKLLN